MIGLAYFYSGCASKEKEAVMPLDDQLAAARADYIEAVRVAEKRGFIEFVPNATLPIQATFESVDWCGRVFHEMVNPHNKKVPSRHFFFVSTDGGFDLLRDDLTVGETKISIFESSVFFAILASSAVDAEASDDLVTKRANELCSLLLNPREQSVFEFKKMKQSPDERSYSTNPDKPVAQLQDWTSRVDCVLIGSDLFILVLKVSLESDHLYDDNPGNWFGEEFKNAVGKEYK